MPAGDVTGRTGLDNTSFSSREWQQGNGQGRGYGEEEGRCSSLQTAGRCGSGRQNAQRRPVPSDLPASAHPVPLPPSHHLRVADKPRLRRTRPNCEAAPSLPRSPRRVRPQSSRRRPSPRRLPHWAAPFSGARTHPQPPWAPAQHRPGTD